MSICSCFTAKTGVLDTAKLHTYKFNDDVFKRVTVHLMVRIMVLYLFLIGLVLWQDEIACYCKAIINLCQFCKKVQIPFEVYHSQMMVVMHNVQDKITWTHTMMLHTILLLRCYEDEILEKKIGLLDK